MNDTEGVETDNSLEFQGDLLFLTVLVHLICPGRMKKKRNKCLIDRQEKEIDGEGGGGREREMSSVPLYVHIYLSA